MMAAMPVQHTPTPGSVEALRLGCRCPVLDNNHGKTPPFPDDCWWINAACPVHGGDPTPQGGT